MRVYAVDAPLRPEQALRFADRQIGTTLDRIGGRRGLPTARTGTIELCSVPVRASYNLDELNFGTYTNGIKRTLYFVLGEVRALVDIDLARNVPILLQKQTTI